MVPLKLCHPLKGTQQTTTDCKSKRHKERGKGGKTRQTWTHFWNVSPWNDCWRRSRTSSALLGPSFSWRMYASPPWVCPPSWTLCPSTSATRQHSLLQLDPPTSQTGKIYIKLNLKKIIRLGCFYAVTNWHPESDLVHVPLLTGTPGQIKSMYCY